MSQRLTPREEQVVELLNLGMTDKQIGEALNIAHGTVKIHVKSAREKGHIQYRHLTNRFIGTRGIIGVVLDYAENPGKLLEEMRNLSAVIGPSNPEGNVYDWVRRICPDIGEDQVCAARRRDACRQLGK